MIIDEQDYLAHQGAATFLSHYGVLRRSGRYPWGSGGPEYATSRSFLGYAEQLRKSGMSETEVAEALDCSTSQLRAAKSIAKAEVKAADIHMAQRLKDKGLSNVAIGERMKINESSVRALLAPGEAEKASALTATAGMLKEQVASKKYIDIGAGVEAHLGMSDTKLKAAVEQLKEEGYKVQYVKVQQLGTNKFTTVKVLTAPDTPYSEVFKNQDQIQMPGAHTETSGHDFVLTKPPKSISSKRLDIRYAEDGGSDADGVMYIRRGAKDLDLGGSTYAQVRIAVDGTHYLKGMAMYKDDLPDGVDIQFNTNKSRKANKLDALKKMNTKPGTDEIDMENPFGAVISRQSGSLNILREEGEWEKWSKSLSTQMLSKQSPILAKQQLDLTFERKQRELDEIMALTNPAVKRRLLEGFADGADSSAVHLKAAALPRQGSHVILPIKSLKDTEVYAPNFKNGESVVLIRYPHGGIFEIPELRVNNNQPDAKKLLGNARDAIGINPQVAAKLSGADFDGDTVLVIPNSGGKVKSKPALEGLKNFDPQREYPQYEGMKVMSPKTKQIQMGVVSNLITDMTIRGASDSELARAVRHSMVVIDAEKHKLNYKQSEMDNGIAALKAKYQTKADSTGNGASTLISRATSDVRVAERKEGFTVNKQTGEKVYRETGASYTDAAGRVIKRTSSSVQLAEAKDAHTLSSGTPIERIYADHSNRLKTMANTARRDAVNTANVAYSPSAKKAYSPEVDALNAKLNRALMNRPLERRAQLVANTQVSAKRAARPDLDASQIKRLKSQELIKARVRVGASKSRIEITDREWEAIQAGAITNNKLKQILDNTDLDRIKELATPRQALLMGASETSRAQSLLARGYTQAEVADQLGVSVTTLKTSLKG